MAATSCTHSRCPHRWCALTGLVLAVAAVSRCSGATRASLLQTSHGSISVCRIASGRERETVMQIRQLACWPARPQLPTPPSAAPLSPAGSACVIWASVPSLHCLTRPTAPSPAAAMLATLCQPSPCRSGRLGPSNQSPQSTLPHKSAHLDSHALSRQSSDVQTGLQLHLLLSRSLGKWSSPTTFRDSLPARASCPLALPSM